MFDENWQRDGAVAETATVRIVELEGLAARHRFNASHADSEWVWEVRLLAAEQLERAAAELRRGCSAAARNAGRAGRSLTKHSWFGIAA
jgi:hypothetical protein